MGFASLSRIQGLVTGRAVGDHSPVPEPIDVVIEIPRGSRNKYEYDHERHVFRLDRRLFTATV